jgi:preprotein translocase subunit SecB
VPTTECKLQLHDLYFSRFDFSLSREDQNTDYNTSFKIEYAIGKSDDSKIKVTIDTSITNKTNTLNLNLQTVALFSIEKEEVDNTLYEQLIKQNTVAIVFPFIRSQVSLLTTQPGIQPILIPPINVAALIE